MKKIKHFIEFLFVQFLYIIGNILNKKIIYKFSELIGILMFYFIPIRKKTALKNLAIAFPEFSVKQIKKIVKQNYINLAKSSLEYCWFHKINKTDIDEFAKFENLEIIQTEVKNKSGIILLGAHFDNPELTANLIKIQTGYDIVALVKQQQNKYVHNFLEKIRKSNNIGLVYKGVAIKEIFRILKQKKILVMVADTATAPNEGNLLNFFNRPTYTPIGPAKFAIRTNSVVIPVFSIRLDDNTHKIIIHNKIEWEKLIDNDENEKIKFIMQQYNDILENYIRRYPNEWFWFHNRWKII